MLGSTCEPTMQNFDWKRHSYDKIDELKKKHSSLQF
jgi:hypothetical protein